MSNSKLTPEQKGDRKNLLTEFERDTGEMYQDPETGVTMVWVPEFSGSRMMRVSFSFMSPDETKFRRKVGEYHALRRMYWTGEYVVFPAELVFSIWKAANVF